MMDADERRRLEQWLESVQPDALVGVGHVNKLVAIFRIENELMKVNLDAWQKYDYEDVRPMRIELQNLKAELEQCKDDYCTVTGMAWINPFRK